MALATDVNRARSLFLGASTMLMAILLPLISIIVLFAPEGLNWWLGPEFSQHGTHVFRWLALGVFINSFARFPLALLQAHHRPDLTAKLHLAELPVYLASVYVLTVHLGIVGTAMAWTLRVALDSLLMFLLAGRILPPLRTAQIQVAMSVGGLALLMGGLSAIESIIHKILAFGVLSAIVLGGGIFLRRKTQERNTANACQSALLFPIRKF
jgi:O-antigen/teichoic acid export membrane protein